GKTSLINSLMIHPALKADAFALVDLTTLDTSSEAAWYRTLCRRILDRLSFINPANCPALVENHLDWREQFLPKISEQAKANEMRIILALDEVGAMRMAWAKPFFCVLRDIFNARQSESCFSFLTFILSGAFHPRDLIRDDNISPFNVAQRIRLLDFSVDQVRKLVAHLSLSEAQ